MPKLLYKKGHIPWTKGKKFTDEHKRKISESKKGIKQLPISEETRKKMSIASKGRIWSIERRKQFSEIKKGKNNPNWNGGSSQLNDRIRHSIEYKIWRKAVFERDNYTCIWCKNNKSGNLNADHIKPFALFPELRFAIDNGRTLCKECHYKTDTHGYRKIYKLINK